MIQEWKPHFWWTILPSAFILCSVSTIRSDFRLPVLNNVEMVGAKVKYFTRKQRCLIKKDPLSRMTSFVFSWPLLMTKKKWLVSGSEWCCWKWRNSFAGELWARCLSHFSSRMSSLIRSGFLLLSDDI